MYVSSDQKEHLAFATFSSTNSTKNLPLKLSVGPHKGVTLAFDQLVWKLSALSAKFCNLRHPCFLAINFYVFSLPLEPLLFLTAFFLSSKSFLRLSTRFISKAIQLSHLHVTNIQASSELRDFSCSREKSFFYLQASLRADTDVSCCREDFDNNCGVCHNFVSFSESPQKYLKSLANFI